MGIFVRSNSGTSSINPSSKVFWNMYRSYTGNLFTSIKIYVSDTQLWIASGKINSDILHGKYDTPIISNLPGTVDNFYITLCSTSGSPIFLEYVNQLHGLSYIVHRNVDGESLYPQVEYQMSSTLVPLLSL